MYTKQQLLHLLLSLPPDERFIIECISLDLVPAQDKTKKLGYGSFNLTMKPYTEEELRIPPEKFEYLDHTADIQFHAWGDTLEEAFEQCAVAMFGYITELDKVEILEDYEIEATGHDMMSLLFHFLDEFLFLFCAEPYLVAKKVKILEFDKENFRIRARGYGENFQIGKHPQGADVKGITYSNMQIYDKENQHEVFVIVDI